MNAAKEKPTAGFSRQQNICITQAARRATCCGLPLLGQCCWLHTALVASIMKPTHSLGWGTSPWGGEPGLKCPVLWMNFICNYQLVQNPILDLFKRRQRCWIEWPGLLTLVPWGSPSTDLITSLSPLGPGHSHMAVPSAATPLPSQKPTSLDKCITHCLSSGSDPNPPCCPSFSVWSKWFWEPKAPHSQTWVCQPNLKAF